jgi:hypothetical protein
MTCAKGPQQAGVAFALTANHIHHLFLLLARDAQSGGQLLC